MFSHPFLWSIYMQISIVSLANFMNGELLVLLNHPPGQQKGRNVEQRGKKAERERRRDGEKGRKGEREVRGRQAGGREMERLAQLKRERVERE